MGLFFIIRALVLLFLIASSLIVNFELANGDLIEGMGWRPAGRTGISPPAPAANQPQRDLPPDYNPVGITNKRKKDRHV
ncbi:hypothetical protein IEQ34_017542 [Dendrobium chrysotoxum]|uniref:Secreted protein n=1 Tax=Dendrobium chrysotoxum TaxID=161865 RepID=A0AAV7GBR6_DENCH|nr:hypothetical protein IEQ34_017542 [Dendrobium chrysotoxum]